jgi:hypothetical protein
MLQGVKLETWAVGDATLVETSKPVEIPATTTAVEITLRKVGEE